MDESSKQPKNLKDISHLFFSTFDEETNSAKEQGESKSKKDAEPIIDEADSISESVPVQDSVEKSQELVTNTVPDISVLSVLPINRGDLSLYYNALFAKQLDRSKYKVVVISINPQQSSLDLLKKHFDLNQLESPVTNNHIQRFHVEDDLDFLFFDESTVDQLLTLDSTHKPSDLGKNKKQHVFLLDFFNLSFFLKERLGSFVDSFIFNSLTDFDNLLDVYKAMKFYNQYSDENRFSMVLETDNDYYLEELLEREYGQIVKKFLKKEIDILGFSSFNSEQPSDSLYNVKLDFVDSSKKQTWSEDFLSLFQSVLSRL